MRAQKGQKSKKFSTDFSFNKKRLERNRHDMYIYVHTQICNDGTNIYVRFQRLNKEGNKAITHGSTKIPKP